MSFENKSKDYMLSRRWQKCTLSKFLDQMGCLQKYCWGIVFNLHWLDLPYVWYLATFDASTGRPASLSFLSPKFWIVRKHLSHFHFCVSSLAEANPQTVIAKWFYGINVVKSAVFRDANNFQNESLAIKNWLHVDFPKQFSTAFVLCVRALLFVYQRNHDVICRRNRFMFFQNLPQWLHCPWQAWHWS